MWILSQRLNHNDRRYFFLCNIDLRLSYVILVDFLQSFYTSYPSEKGQKWWLLSSFSLLRTLLHTISKIQGHFNHYNFRKHLLFTNFFNVKQTLLFCGRENPLCWHKTLMTNLVKERLMFEETSTSFTLRSNIDPTNKQNVALPIDNLFSLSQILLTAKSNIFWPSSHYANILILR